ncbi:MAG TPA: hypothetical protein VGM84_00740 [Steroidobacteraceae bacterium]|jgi:hypothetical protein
MSLIKKAVAAALVTSVATSAYAVDVSSYNGDATKTNVYVSGSTAVNIVLWQSAVHTPAGATTTALCNSSSGTIDVYSDAADTKNPAAQIFIYCKGSTASGVPGNIALFKESAIGSINGSQPLINQTTASNTVKFVDATTLTDAACAAGVAGTLPGAQPYTFHANCVFPVMTTAQAAAVKITGGISDVEATLLGVNSSSITSSLQSAPGLAPVWAAAVNQTFYDQLRKAQCLDGSCPGKPLVSPLTPAGVPSLTKAQLAAIYSQQLADSSQIAGTGATPGTVIGICRREFGSGTEASAELFWLGEGCGTSDLVVPPGDNVNVFENTSTGKIAACLQQMDIVGGTVNGQPAGGPRPAVGIVSSENGPSTFGSGTMRVVGVDGALPTLENVANGFYPFFSEDVLYNNSSSTIYTGNPKKVWELVKSNIGTPAFLADSNKAFQNYWGDSGDLAPPSIYGAPSVIPATQTSVRASPISGLTKSPNGTVNNCDTAVVFGASNTAPYQFLNQ